MSSLLKIGNFLLNGSFMFVSFCLCSVLLNLNYFKTTCNGNHAVIIPSQVLDLGISMAYQNHNNSFTEDICDQVFMVAEILSFFKSNPMYFTLTQL